VVLGCAARRALGAWGGRRPWLERERGHLAAWAGRDAWDGGLDVAFERGRVAPCVGAWCARVDASGSVAPGAGAWARGAWALCGTPSGSSPLSVSTPDSRTLRPGPGSTPHDQAPRPIHHPTHPTQPTRPDAHAPALARVYALPTPQCAACRAPQHYAPFTFLRIPRPPTAYVRE